MVRIPSFWRPRSSASPPHIDDDDVIVRRRPSSSSPPQQRDASQAAAQPLQRRDPAGPMATPRPLMPRWENGEPCTTCQTTTVWSTYYVDQQGSSTTCLTTDYEQTTLTNSRPTPTATYYTVMQTMTSTLYDAPPATPTSAPSTTTTPVAIPQKTIQLDGQNCDCQGEWMKLLLGGVPHGAAEVIACLVFFFPFLLFLLLTLARLAKYKGIRAIFLALLPFTLFLATMVALLPTRAFASTNNSTNHILEQHVMLSIAPSILLEVALQVYGMLKKRAEPSGWIDASSLFLRLINIAALALYAVSASELVSFVHGWEHGTLSCATGMPNQIATLAIIADFLELGVLCLGFFFLFWARWKLRMHMPVLIIQAHIFALFAVLFIWRLAHDLGATTGWSHRQDTTCAPLGTVYGNGGSDSGGIFYYYLIPWGSVFGLTQHGLNGQAPFWLLAILPLFLATCILMTVNLIVYLEAVPDIMPQADSARYKLCYNEDAKKMEFVRLDNPGGPRLASGEQLYEIVRGDDGEGWEIREAKVDTVLPVWHHMTVRPWYR